MAHKPICQDGPQCRFMSSTADITIMGGAAGGGKTFALLVEPLFHTDNPDFGAVIFRQSYPQITMEGGMWDESTKLYSAVRPMPAPKVGKLRWVFASGAKVSFAYMKAEDDKLIYQGAQIPLIGFDQLEQMSEGQFFYMLSRNRSTCGVKPYVRATCNPDADSWLAKFLEWWINQETGYPLEERDGELRWFVRPGSELVWANDAGTLLTQYPELIPKSVTFIHANVYDNKILLQRNPEYLANLLALPVVERERLLRGNWKIRPTAGLLCNRAWFSIVDVLPAGGSVVRFWDFAATEKKTAKADPDYTAAVRMHRVGDGFYISDCFTMRAGPTDVEKAFIAITKQDWATAQRLGIPYKVAWEIEPGSSGKMMAARLTSLVAGVACAPRRPSGDKIQRAGGFLSQAEAGFVKLLKGDWNEPWLLHMHNAGMDAKKWDIWDSTAGVFNELAGMGSGKAGMY